MSYTVAQTIDELGVAVPARVRAAAGRYPAALTRWIYLEHRLGGDPERVDLILRVDRDGARVAHDPFLAGWAGAPWADRLAAVWIELDLPAEGAPPARFFLDYRRGLDLAPLEALLGGPPPALVRERLAACVAALPAGAFVFSTGVWRRDPRGWERIRLCIQGLGRESLPAYLRAIGWRGRPNFVESGARLLLDLDLEDRVADRIGVEHLLCRRSQRRGVFADAEGRFLDGLVARGLCGGEQRRALAAWPGPAIRTLPHELWPSLVLRRVNHVKLIHDGRETVEAKAYLSLSCEPRR